MRIKNIKTGKILSVDKCYDMYNNSDYYYVRGTGEKIYENFMADYYEYIEPDWEKLRCETASRCLTTIYDSKYYQSTNQSILDDTDTLVDISIKLADALIKKLKETYS